MTAACGGVTLDSYLEHGHLTQAEAATGTRPARTEDTDDPCIASGIRQLDPALKDKAIEIKKTMPGRRVLRSRTWAGIAQEVYALLSTYQALRIAITDATGAVPDTDPDRASFSIALQTARDQVVQAKGVIAGTVTGLAGTIGQAVLDHLMPARRLRVSPRAASPAGR